MMRVVVRPAAEVAVFASGEGGWDTDDWNFWCDDVGKRTGPICAGVQLIEIFKGVGPVGECLERRQYQRAPGKEGMCRRRTKATIFAPSVKLPAPIVTSKSASFSLASAVTSSTSDHSVCGLIPYRIPTTLAPRASCSWLTWSVFLAKDPEAMMYTLRALKVASTCLAQASANGMPYERCGYPVGKAGR
jgi:hypothetical protein